MSKPVLIILAAMLSGCAAVPPEPVPEPLPAPAVTRLPPVYHLGVIWQAGGEAGAARQGAGLPTAE